MAREEESSGTSPRPERLQKFWQWRLDSTNSVEELKEFGWWVAEGRFNSQWLLERLIDTLKKTGGLIEADFRVVVVLAKLAATYRSLTAEALFLMIKAHNKGRGFFLHGHRDETATILRQVYASENRDAIAMADKMVDYLTKLGFESYRNLKESVRSKTAIA